MYTPRHFEEDRIELLAELMRTYPLATLVSLDRDRGGLIATHLPLIWDPAPEPLGTLRGHVARANPHGSVASGATEALAVFLGPQAYISPSGYPSKREHGKVVPTWNYVAVHAYGPLRAIDDRDWLRAFVTRLTDLHEASLSAPWKVSDAPEGFVENMLGGIVGIELALTRIEGKWKLSQNRPAADQEGTVAHLEARGQSGAREMAAAMLEAGLRGSRVKAGAPLR